MPSQNHVHQYVKYKKRKNAWRCNLPDCTHFADKEVVVGKYTQCNLCTNVFILTKEDARRTFPRCQECSNTKKSKNLREAQTLVNSVLGKLMPVAQELDPETEERFPIYNIENDTDEDSAEEIEESYL